MQYIMKSTALSSIFLFAVYASTNGFEAGPSSATEFLAQPANVTVPVGEPVVLKCTVASKATLCRWYYLELGLQFFEKRVTPMLVKEFSPASRQDCSIKINKVRKVQEGQWLCQALKFQSSKFLMTEPAIVRVMTEEESRTWEPPVEDPNFIPRDGRREDGANNPNELDARANDLVFDSKNDDMIQDVFVQETALLKCKVNQPISLCSWITPRGGNISVFEDYDSSSNSSNGQDNYTIYSNLRDGNCSMQIHKVGYHDEGNWRCVVKSADVSLDRLGPLLHLHILDENTASKHTHDGTPLVEESDSANSLVVFLVTVSIILFIIVLLLLLFLYRRFHGNSDEKQNILGSSTRSSFDYQRKVIPVTDLTAASVMAVEARKKLPLDDDQFSHYNQYLDMSGTGSNMGDGYIMMPGSSLRSSTSSRTTLSTLSTLPMGRSRSASSSTTSSANFPHLIDNPSYNLNIINHQKGLPRPTSLYSTDHVYEEIKEKMEKIPEAETPTYTNIVEDFEGYLIPKKSVDNDIQNIQRTVPISKPPLPNPNKSSTLSLNEQKNNEEQEHRPPPPYSQVSENGLVPVGLVPVPSLFQAPGELPPGYSRVGNNDSQVDPMERYDTPRPYNPMDSYDVPQQMPVLINSQQLVNSTSVDGLPGIIV